MKYLLLGIALVGMIVGAFLYLSPQEYDASLECETIKRTTCANEDCSVVNILDSTICSDGTGHGTDGTLQVTPNSVEELFAKEISYCGDISSRIYTPSGVVIGCSAIITETTYFDKEGNETAVASSFLPIQEYFYRNGGK